MNTNFKKGILIAFGELFLKSEGVRKLFQRRLIQNLRFFLEKEDINFKILSFRERIFIKTDKISKASNIIKKVFGIVWFAECLYFPEINLKNLSNFIGENYKNWIKKDETFAIRLRLEKRLLKESRKKVIEKLAQKIDRKVNLEKPTREIFVEIRKSGSFLYFKKRKGTGGLPVGGSGKVLSLVSGGIDSPVAAYLIAKRGAENIWLHFHSFPLVSKVSIEKTKELAKVFLKYQPHLKIYFVPFQKAQVEIKTKAPSNYRILLYRRLMFKIAERIANRENCQSLVTGESLGQVSSQTLENIKIIEESLKIPVLRPLIGMDKEEIIKLAKKIKAYYISTKPQEDCCTLFVPKHQTAKGDLETVKKIEKRINVKEIIKEIIADTEIEEK